MAITPIRPKWKGTMTDRERFNAQMHYKPIDRCFNMEFGYWEENYREWDIFVKNNIKSEGEANIFFNFDRYAMAGGSTWMSPPFEHKIISESGDKRILQNGDGLLAEVPADGHDTIPHYLKSSIETPDDWKKVKAERFRLDDPARIVNIADLKKMFPDDRDYPVGVWSGSMIGQIRNMLTFEGLAYALYDYPEMVEDMVETCCLLVEHWLDQVLGHVQFDYAGGWEDICFKNGPIVSVPFFRDVVMPRYKRISQRLHKHGIYLWWIDCDGDVRPILKYFLEGGVNCMFPYEVAGCCHPAELLRDWGKDLRIMGGFDKMEMAKDKKAIDTYMESLIPLVERGGYIPFCDHRCPPNVSVENYLYYLDKKEKTFGLK